MISVICCYNDEKQYYDMVNSLADSTIEYELIGINNEDSRFASAAAALNYGGVMAKGDWLVFLHQDIFFGSKTELERLVEDYKKIPCELAVLGLFGASRDKGRKIIENIYSADTLDECLVIMNKKTFLEHKFNEKICDGWHLYVAELCIRVRQGNGIVAVGKYNIKHLSIGNVDEAYMKTFKCLLSVYKSEKWISTTCKSMPTSMIAFYLYYFPWKIKKLIFGNYPLMSKVKNKKHN